MFKIIALCGAIAGGATYGLYTQTDVFGSKCGGDGCPLAALKSCCESNEPSAEPKSPCCESGSAATAPESCCLSKASAKKAASCCANPCPECVKAACEACPTCADCCGDGAKTAVAGSFAAVVSAPKK
jgi:hypothetical protein